MRKMADDSKGTLLALTLELLRIDITNEHIRQVIDYLGQAVARILSRLAFASIFEGFPIPSGTTDFCCLRIS